MADTAEELPPPALIEALGPCKMLMVCSCGNFLVDAGTAILRVYRHGEPVNMPTLEYRCPGCDAQVSVFEAGGCPRDIPADFVYTPLVTPNRYRLPKTYEPSGSYLTALPWRVTARGERPRV